MSLLSPLTVARDTFFSLSAKGVFESGLYPAAIYLVTQWYLRHENQVRSSAFYAGASLAGAFSGLLAFGLGHLDGHLGYHAWRYIFAVEGLITVAVGIVAPLIFINLPEKAGSWLTEDEKRFVILRLQYDAGPVPQRDTYSKKSVIAAFTDWKVLLGTCMAL
jgi:MFS family permease